jgi:hypothetical protein
LISHGWDDLFLDLDPQRGLKAGERWQAALKQEGPSMKMLVKTCRLVHSDQPVLGIADASGIAGLQHVRVGPEEGVVPLVEFVRFGGVRGHGP